MRVARALEQLPEISDAFAKGELSYSKVRAMTRVATAANESVLVSVARHGTAAHIEKLVRKFRWTQRRDAAQSEQRQHEFRNVSSFFDDDGTFIVHARLPAEVGAVVHKALRLAAEAVRPPNDVSAETPLQIPAHARSADAFRLMAETYLAHHGEETAGSSSADRVQVVVHIDQAILSEASAATAEGPHRCELEEGPALALDTARRLACDSTVVGIVEGEDGEPLDIGRKSRSIPPAIARALKARDGGCRFPGCDRTRFCEGHHIKHWANGGETKLSNLITLCGFHHRLVHEGGYGLRATMQRELLRGVPDAVVRPGLAEVVAGRRTVRALSLDDGVEGVAGSIDDVGGERVFEHDDARPVSQRTNQLGLQGAPVGRRGGRIDQDVLAHIDGVRVVGEVGVSQHLGPELVKPAVGLVDPRLVCSGQRRCHGS